MTPPFSENQKFKVIEYGDNCPQSMDWSFFKRLIQFLKSKKA